MDEVTTREFPSKLVALWVLNCYRLVGLHTEKIKRKVR